MRLCTATSMLQTDPSEGQKRLWGHKYYNLKNCLPPKNKSRCMPSFQHRQKAALLEMKLKMDNQYQLTHCYFILVMLAVSFSRNPSPPEPCIHSHGSLQNIKSAFSLCDHNLCPMTQAFHQQQKGTPQFFPTPHSLTKLGGTGQLQKISLLSLLRMKHMYKGHKSIYLPRHVEHIAEKNKTRRAACT